MSCPKRDAPSLVPPPEMQVGLAESHARAVELGLRKASDPRPPLVCEMCLWEALRAFASLPDDDVSEVLNAPGGVS